MLDNSFRTPLHWAAISNKSSIVRCLLASGADVSSMDCHGGTALYYAAFLRHCDCVRVLSQHPGVTEQLQRAVEWAAAAQADECIRIMVEHGAQLVSLNDREEWYCPGLVLAARCGHVGTVALLLSLCNVVNGADHTGVTALHAAALGGHPHCAKYLLRHRATLAQRDRHGRHVLHYAALGGHSHFAALVIKAGTDVNVQDSYGLTCLHVTAMRGYLALMNLLIENGADVNLTDFQGASTLHYAARRGDVAVVSTLLEMGAIHSDLAHFHVEDGSVNSVTPLDLALERNHCAVVELLQASGAVTAKDLREVASCVIQDAWRRYHQRKKINFLEENANRDGRPSNSVAAVNPPAQITSAWEEPAGNLTVCQVRPLSRTARTVDAVKPSRSLPLTRIKKGLNNSISVDSNPLPSSGLFGEKSQQDLISQLRLANEEGEKHNDDQRQVKDSIDGSVRDAGMGKTLIQIETKSAKAKDRRSSSVAECHETQEEGSDKSSEVVHRQLSEDEHHRKVTEFRQWRKGVRVKEVRRLDGNFSYNLCRPPPGHTTSSCTNSASRGSSSVSGDRNKNFISSTKCSQIGAKINLSQNQ